MTDKPHIIQFSKIPDQRGNLSVIEENKDIPFSIERVYWIYDVPGGAERHGHAYKSQQEVIVAISGSFDVVLHDGKTEQRFQLNRSYYGLYIPKLTWRVLDNFSSNSLALIVSDQAFKESEYIRDFETFKKTIIITND